jgi:uncharacterized protein (DUF1697 family)
MAALAAHRTARQRRENEPMTRMIALLRAINVGKRQLPMAELRMLAADLGFQDAQTYVASGNLVFTAGIHDPEAAATRLEQAIAARYGWTSEAILRTTARWATYAAGSPFANAERDRAKMLHLLLSRRPPASDAAARIAERCAPGERVAAEGDAIWIDFAGGVGRSRLTPAFIDKCVGSPTTARNWNTVLQLDAMART